MQLCRIIYYSLAALYVSSDIFVHRQEHLNYITASGITYVCRCQLPAATYGILREILMGFGIKNYKHFSTYSIAYSHVKKSHIFEKICPIPKLEHYPPSYIFTLKQKRCTNFSNLFLE
jgi:hypothetical protein